MKSNRISNARRPTWIARRGEPARRDRQRAVPPMVEGRRQRRPDLAHDLDPAVQRRDGRLPVAPRQLGPGAAQDRVRVVDGHPSTSARRAIELGDPFPQPIEMLGVVIAAGLADPPGRLVARAGRAPTTRRSSASGRRWPGPRRRPMAGRAIASRNAAFSASMSTSWPSYVPAPSRSSWTSASASHVPRWATTSRTVHVRIAVVAGFEALLGRQPAHELEQLVPALALGVDLGGDTDGPCGGSAASAVGSLTARSRSRPRAGRPASSQSSSPPE